MHLFQFKPILRKTSNAIALDEQFLLHVCIILYDSLELFL